MWERMHRAERAELPKVQRGAKMCLQIGPTGRCSVLPRCLPPWPFPEPPPSLRLFRIRAAGATWWWSLIPTAEATSGSKSCLLPSPQTVPSCRFPQKWTCCKSDRTTIKEHFLLKNYIFPVIFKTMSSYCRKFGKYRKA